MANPGDAAILAGMDVPLSTDKVRDGYIEIATSRDYIADRTSAVTPVTKGGTGAETPAVARVNLGITSDNIGRPGGETVEAALTWLRDNTATKTQLADAEAAAAAESAVVWGNAQGRVSKYGDTMTGNLFLPGATPATSSYTVLYLNGDGRVSKGASTERAKDDIQLIDPAALGDVFPDLYEFVMKDDPGRTPRIGNIAERLNEHPEQARFVVYQRTVETDGAGNIIGSHLTRDDDGNPIPESIDFISLAIAQNARQAQQITDLTARIDRLESPGVAS